MKDGDISNEVVPRLLIEFEGLLGHPPNNVVSAALARKMGKWRKFVDMWDIDELVAKVIIDRSNRLRQDIDIITTYPAEFAQALEERLYDEDIDVRKVWSFEPNRLARKVDFMFHVAAVYTADVHRSLLYGQKGRFVTPYNVTQIGLF